MEVAATSYPIGPNPPKSVPWSPVQILYSRLTMSQANDASSAGLNPQNYVIAIDSTLADPVAAFVQLRLSDPSAPVAHSGVYNNPDPDRGPCDIFLEQQCFVVFEIDESLPWRFPTTQPCLTLKAVYQHNGDDDNFGLRCADLDPSGRFASFNVAIRSASSGPNTFTKEGYNIVLQSQADGSIYIIDPDGTNQGTIPAPSP